MIAAIITVACSFLALPLGPWFDRGGHGWARKYRSAVMAAGYFIFSIFTGIGALTSSIWSIVVLQSVKNAFGGAGEAIEVTAMAESYPVERRGFALGIQHTAYPWGTLIASFVTSAILATFGPENWRYVFLLIPLAMIPIWIGYWLFATKKRYQKFERDTEAAGLTKPLTGSDDETHRAAPGAMGRALRNPNIIVPSIASMLGIAVYIGISFWLPQYIAFVGNYSFAETAAYSAVFTITGGIGQILWGSVSDWLGRKFTAILAFTWLAVGIYLLQYAGSGIDLVDRAAAVRGDGHQRRLPGDLQLCQRRRRAWRHRHRELGDAHSHVHRRTCHRLVLGRTHRCRRRVLLSHRI